MPFSFKELSPPFSHIFLFHFFLASVSPSLSSQDRHFSSAHATDVAEQKELLLERLAEFDTSNKSLRKLLRAQQAHEVHIHDLCSTRKGKVEREFHEVVLVVFRVPFHMQSSARHLSEQREVLLQKLTESDFTNQLLHSQLDEKEKLTLHSQVAPPPSFLPSFFPLPHPTNTSPKFLGVSVQTLHTASVSCPTMLISSVQAEKEWSRVGATLRATACGRVSNTFPWSCGNHLSHKSSSHLAVHDLHFQCSTPINVPYCFYADPP